MRGKETPKMALSKARINLNKNERVIQLDKAWMEDSTLRNTLHRLSLEHWPDNGCITLQAGMFRPLGSALRWSQHEDSRLWLLHCGTGFSGFHWNDNIGEIMHFSFETTFWIFCVNGSTKCSNYLQAQLWNLFS